MFETGPGNLDLVRLLRDTPDVTASSLIVTVYRTLNNDTDLSEVSRLARPALNFAFVRGRGALSHHRGRHAAHRSGSMQQEGTQALSVVRALGAGPLPRPVTGDAVFTDLMPFGLVYYAEGVTLPLALCAVMLFVMATILLRSRERRWIRETVVGALVAVVSIAIAGGVAAGAAKLAAKVHTAAGGDPAYAAAYAIAIVMLAMGAALACWSAARRWYSDHGLHHGVLLVWTLLGVAASLKLPGASFVIVWPLLAALLAAIAHRAGRAAHAAMSLAAAYVALALLVPMIATFGPVLLGLIGAGGIMTGVLVALLAGIVMPQLESLLPGRLHRIAATSAGIGVIAMLVGALTVRVSAAHPVPSLLAYVADADSGAAWLTTPASFARPGSWTADVLGSTMRTGSPGAARDSSGLPAWLGDGDIAREPDCSASGAACGPHGPYGIGTQ